MVALARVSGWRALSLNVAVARELLLSVLGPCSTQTLAAIAPGEKDLVAKPDVQVDSS